MTQVTFKGSPISLEGNSPKLHTKAPDFALVDKDLHTKTLNHFHGKKKILSTVPSLDTGVCSTMTKHLNEIAKKHPEIILITVSADLPFAQKRFCETENVHNIFVLSMMRDKEFGKKYGLLIKDGPLEGLLARAIIILDEKDHVQYVEIVPEITQEPNYQKAIKALIGQ